MSSTGDFALRQGPLEPGAPVPERERAQVVVALGEESNATNEAGVSPASISTRDAAGWIRSDRRSKSRPWSVAMTISPSTTQRSGSWSRNGSMRSGK